MPKDTDETLHELSEYELQRLERIRKNEAYLEKLGLMHARNKLLQATTAPTKRNQQRRKKKPTPTKPSRRSHRLSNSTNKDSNEGNNLVMLSYYDDNDDARAAVPQGQDGPSSPSGSNNPYSSSSSPPSASFRKIRRSILPNAADFQLTADERAILARNTMDDNYLHKFQEFLVYHNKISDQNVRAVMRQVTKLARGEGIHYDSPTYGWKPHQYFQKGVKITPLSDFVALMEQAADCEAKWGRDHGNGWLLSHPLKKMLLFQQFCLQNPDFLSTASRLSAYYAKHDQDLDDEEEVDVGEDLKERDTSIVSATEPESISSGSEQDPVSSPGSLSTPASSSNKRRAVKANLLEETLSHDKSNPRSFVGRRVAKYFGDEVFLGTLQSYRPRSKFWQVLYDDDDAEEYDSVDLQTALNLYDSLHGHSLPKKVKLEQKS